MLKTPSPNATLPNKGAALIPDTSPYHSAIATLFEDVTSNDARQDRFKRKAAKLKRLEDAVSAGWHPSLIMRAYACLCGAPRGHCTSPFSIRPMPHECGNARQEAHKPPECGTTRHDTTQATRMWHSNTQGRQPILPDHPNVAPHLITQRDTTTTPMWYTWATRM